MSTVYRHEGWIWDYTPAADVTSNQLVVIGTVCGVVQTDGPANVLNAARVRGVVEVACPSAEDITQGAKLSLDVAGQEMQLAAGDLADAGVATSAAGVGVTTVYVSLNPGTV